MGKVASKYVAEKHRAAEIIINTGKPPKNWTYQFEKRIAKLEENLEAPQKILKIQKKAKDKCLKGIGCLIDYFKKSPLVKDEEIREILLSELQKVQNLWKKEENRKEIITH